MEGQTLAQHRPIKLQRKPNRVLHALRRRYDLYLMLVLPLLYYVIFHYIPMYGVQIAFKDFIATKGITGSHWAGMKYFQRFFDSYYLWRLLWNTVSISLYNLVISFPIPIFLALLINEIKNARFKKWVQNVTYMPHFISVVVVVGMLNIFLEPKHGLLNLAIASLGGEKISFLTAPEWFKAIFISSDIWQHMGWQSIIYIAALSGIDPSLYEAAVMDGASRMRRIWHISIPGILPTIIILFILHAGHMMDVGFEKILLMQNSLNRDASDVISTFIYREGIQKGEYSYTAAIGLFNSVINFALLIAVNWVARRKSETSLW